MEFADAIKEGDGKEYIAAGEIFHMTYIWNTLTICVKMQCMG